jgi:hypothetical protein
MDDNYFNANALQPRFDPNAPPGLGGFLYANQQQKFNQANSLQQLMQQQKFSEYLQDEPVRENTRLGDIAFQQGRAQTAIPMAHAGLQEKQLGNELNQRTMGSKVQKAGTEASEGQYNFDRKKFREGIEMFSALADTAADAGPDALSRIRTKLKDLNIDENDPIVQYVMAGTSPDDIRTRSQYVQHRMHTLDRQYAQAEMIANKDITGKIIWANVMSDKNANKQPGDRPQERRWQEYLNLAKQQYPNLPDAQIRGIAIQMMDSAQYGAAKTNDTAENKQLEDSISSLEATVGFLSPDSPLKKQLSEHIKLLKAQRGLRSVPYNGAPQPQPGAQPGQVPPPPPGFR